MGKDPAPSTEEGQDFAQGPLVTGPGFSLLSPRPLPWPRPHQEPGAQLSVPVLLCPGHWGPAFPLTPSFQTGLSSCPPQGGKPPAPPQTAQEESWNPDVYVTRQGEFTCSRGRTGDRSNRGSRDSREDILAARPPHPPRGASAADVCPGWHEGRKAHSSGGTRSGCSRGPGRACGGGG